MSVFQLVNWLLAFSTCAILTCAIWADRSLIIKPSIMAIIFFHVMCQWGTAIESARIESYLSSPWIFILLSHGFPLIGLLVSMATWRRSARFVWKRVVSYKLSMSFPQKNSLILLSFVFLVFLIIYILHVPITNTGLYSILISPEESAQTRELSAKLLENSFVRYDHAFMTSVLDLCQLSFYHKL